VVGDRHPHSAPEALRATERYLATQFSKQQWAVTTQAFGARGHTYRNVLAVKASSTPASGPQAPPLLVGAHYDTVSGSPGADDNASALAVLLEVAYRLKRVAVMRPVWLAAFCLEEEGLLGSRAFVAKLRRSQETLAGAIVLECVGYTDRTPGSQKAPTGLPMAIPSTGDFLAVIGNDASRMLMDVIAESARSIIVPLSTVSLAVPGRGEQLPDVRRSDHASFWDEDYPAVMLTDTANFRNPHYHRPTDTVDTLDLHFIEQVAEVVLCSVLAVASGKRP